MTVQETLAIGRHWHQGDTITYIGDLKNAKAKGDRHQWLGGSPGVY